MAGIVSIVALSPHHASAQTTDLFVSKGCVGCHSIGGMGGQVGPALDTVGDRRSAEWLYKWLHNPAAVKPGTKMPNLGLTDDERARLVFFLLAQRSGQTAAATESSRTPPSAGDVPANTPDLDRKSPENAYLSLGVGSSYIDRQRYTLQDQIQGAIPPIYEPALTESAFVLPPGSLRAGIAYRNVARIRAEDISGVEKIGATFADYNLKRSFLDFDAFLGLDHNMTLRVNVPIVSSDLNQHVHPNFESIINAYPTAGTTQVGDTTIFLKKKFLDQGNFPIGIAGMGAISLPSGSHSERFNSPTVMNMNMMGMTIPMGPPALGLMRFPQALDDNGKPIPNTADGTFRRFTNDGRLPAPLQPGLGTVGGKLGLFATRQFEGGPYLGRGAVHTGAIYEFRPEADGIDPGNMLTAYASLVKPVWKDYVSLDLTYLFQHQDDDHYKGKYEVPSGANFIGIDRQTFTGGDTQFIGGSIILVANPLFRVTASGLHRIVKPDHGPSPSDVFRLGITYTFSSGLYQ